MTHALDHHELGPRNGVGGRDAAGERHQRVDISMDDQGRDMDGTQRILAAAGRRDRGELTGDTRRVQAPVETFRGTLRIARFVERKSWSAQDTPCLSIAGKIRLTIGRRRGE